MGRNKDEDLGQIGEDDKNLTLNAQGWKTGDPAADLLGDIRDDVEYG